MPGSDGGEVENSPHEIDWETVVRSLPFQGQFDEEAFASALGQLMAYEDWVGAGRPVTVDHLPALPNWYLGAAYLNPMAFEYLRHSAMAYFRRAHTKGPSFSGVFLSLIRRIRETHPESYTELAEAMREAGDQFDRQHSNARRAHQRMMKASEEEQLEIALQWYVSFFETNLYLWFLCVLGRFMQTGRVEPQAFGGPLTEVAQGTLVNQALDELADTPLHAAVEFVYDIQLRNAISHNDYDLTTDRTKTLVLHPDGRTLSWEEVWEVLGYAQDFHQGLLGAIATVITAPRPEDWLILREYGVTSLDWLISNDGPIEVVLHQLWCFAELDPDGCWLDAADFTICKLAEGGPDEVAVRFGTAGFINVPKEAGVDVLHTALEQQQWLLVTRYPVAPFLGLGYPRYTGEFEVVGTPDEHIVRFAGVETIDPANLAPRPPGPVEAEEQKPD